MNRQDRALETRARLVTAAGELFAEMGYAAASTTELLARTGLSRGALTHHFPTKEDLADAVMVGLEEALVMPDRPIALQSLIDLTYAYADALVHNPVLRGAARLATETGPYSGPAGYTATLAAVEDVLQRAADRGELLPTVAPARTARVIIGSYTGVQLVSQMITGRGDLTEQVEAWWEHLLPAIAVPGVITRLRFSRPQPQADTGDTPPG
jgi:AcrR family transcriptional regulator